MFLKSISKTVWLLCFVSLFNDMASEMLYPVMPVFLKSIGFSVVLIGILEGVAEATAGISKGFFGGLSDQTGKRVPFVRAGYALSALAKPMMVLILHPLWIFCARTLERFGKGIRTAARDAILSDESTRETKGKIFGLHRGMDTVGAFIGPIIALIFLNAYPGQYKTLFLLAFLPGVLTVAATFLLRDKERKIKADKNKPRNFLSAYSYWNRAPETYRKLCIGLLVFALVNSSDVFLLLRAKESGMSDTSVIGFYIFFNLVFAVTSLPIGIIADKIGLKKMLIVGLIIFAFVYLGMGFFETRNAFYILFFGYGLYAAASDGISKALISNISDSKDTATAIGVFSGFQSICAMLASTCTGLIWYQFGAAAALISTAVITFLVALYLILFVPIKTVH